MKHDQEQTMIAAANRRFDAQNPHISQSLRKSRRWTAPEHARIRAGWQAHQLTLRGKLTDKKVAQYAAGGHYSNALPQARAAYRARKQWFYGL